MCALSLSSLSPCGSKMAPPASCNPASHGRVQSSSLERKTTFSSQELQRTSYKSLAKVRSSSHPHAIVEQRGLQFPGLAWPQHESSFVLTTVLFQWHQGSSIEKKEGCWCGSCSVSIGMSSWLLSAWSSDQGHHITCKLIRSTHFHSLLRATESEPSLHFNKTLEWFADTFKYEIVLVYRVMEGHFKDG